MTLKTSNVQQDGSPQLSSQIIRSNQIKQKISSQQMPTTTLHIEHQSQWNIEQSKHLNKTGLWTVNIFILNHKTTKLDLMLLFVMDRRKFRYCISALFSHSKLSTFQTKSLVLQRTERLQILPFSEQTQLLCQKPVIV